MFVWYKRKQNDLVTLFQSGGIQLWETCENIPKTKSHAVWKYIQFSHFSHYKWTKIRSTYLDCASDEEKQYCFFIDRVCVFNCG